MLKSGEKIGYCELCSRKGNAATMVAALIVTCILAVASIAAAEPPLSIVGEGLLSKPPQGKPGVKYAGPIVYSNEKPPIIYFPPPPKDAQPGFGGFFGKSKSPKSIKYVPMPHHDLPVLIYTSDKTPPIHVVQPPQVESSPQSPQPFSSSFGPVKNGFGPPSGSLSSTYRGIIPAESTSARVVTSSYEIPGTSYGAPVNPFRSPSFPPPIGSFDMPFASGSSSNEVSSPPPAPPSFGPPVSEISPKPFGAPPKSKPPHIVYSGHPPIHMFNEPDMFVRAPKEIPLKAFYEDMPPKASFGPPKSSFGPPSAGSNFGPPEPSYSHRPSFGHASPSAYRTLGVPLRENLLSSATVSNPSTASLTSVKSHAPVSPSPPQPTYSFSPSYNRFSVGPFSVEYGPPTEPFMSFSNIHEPTGSLSSLYEQISDAPQGLVGSSSSGNDDWIPGPPPTDIGGHIKEDAWNHPLPTSGHGSPPNSMHGSVLLPNAHHHGPPPPHPGLTRSKLAQFFSSFKLKRQNKPKYAVAPKSMHKPPIIIYYGKTPPVHVYQKPDEEITTSEGTTSSFTITSPSDMQGSSEGRINHIMEAGKSREAGRHAHLDSVDLTYGGSQKSEVRVAPPPPKPTPVHHQTHHDHVATGASQNKPIIIPARSIDIYPQTELQPSIYMSRNSLNTIYVSDLSGSGTRAIKTYVVRRDQDDSVGRAASAPKIAVAEATVLPPYTEVVIPESSISNNGHGEGSIISIPIAQNRISGVDAQPQQGATSSFVLPQVAEDKEEVELMEGDNNDGASSDTRGPTILVLNPAAQKELEEAEEQQQQEEEQPAESQVQVAVVQSPSSFQQSSLSQAEKEVSSESTDASSSSSLT